MPFFFVPPNVEKLIDRKNVRGLIKALRYEESLTIREQAANGLGALGNRRAVMPLIDALEDRITDVRRSAAAALGKLGDDRAVEPLIAVLSDVDSRVRRAAVLALSEIADPRAQEPVASLFKTESRSDVRQQIPQAFKALGATDLLIAALEDQDRAVRHTAARVLSEVNDPRALKPLASLFKTEWDYSMRRYFVQAFKALGATDLIIGALGDKHLFVRQEAVQALSAMNDPQTIESLAAALGDPERQIRQQAVEALEKLNWQPDRGTAGAAYWGRKRRWDKCVEIGPPAIEPLATLVRDSLESTASREQAVDALVKIGTAQATDALVRALEALKDDQKSTSICSKVIAALRESGSPQAAKLLGEAEAAYWVHKQQWQKCVEIGAPAVEPLVAFAQSRRGFSTDRSLAIEALGEIGDARATGPLIQLLDEPGRQSYAAVALGKIGDPRAVQPLVSLLGDRYVGSKATQALARIGAPAVKPLGVCLQKGKPAVRRDAARALARMGTAQTIEPLVRALKDQDEYVRQEASTALDKMGWQPEDGATRVAQWLATGQWERCAALGAKAVEPLIAALGQSSPAVGDHAVRALVKIGEPAVGPLVKFLADNSVSQWTRSKAARALGEIGDVRAVEPLLDALKEKQSWDVIQALGRLGDARAVKPLVALLQDKDWVTRDQAISALAEIGDARAIEPLAALLAKAGSEPTKAARANKGLFAVDAERATDPKTILNALARLGWQPGGDTASAVHCVAERQWDRCVKIGGPAIRPLIAALSDKDKSVRQGAASALVGIYRSGSLGKAQKASILAQRDTILRPHQDETKHVDEGAKCAGNHDDRRLHTDVGGLGVDFPL